MYPLPRRFLLNLVGKADSGARRWHGLPRGWYGSKSSDTQGVEGQTASCASPWKGAACLAFASTWRRREELGRKVCVRGPGSPQWTSRMAGPTETCIQAAQWRPHLPCVLGVSELGESLVLQPLRARVVFGPNVLPGECFCSTQGRPGALCAARGLDATDGCGLSVSPAWKECWEVLWTPATADV